jgi:hypothetical protein
MHKRVSYRILVKGLRLGLCVAACAAMARAQQAPRNTPAAADVYCSGIVDTKPVPNDTYVISGENANDKTIFFGSDFIFINRGGEKGVKVGDRFEVVRPIQDPTATTWFKYQPMLTRAMGTTYADIGQLHVIHVDAKTSTAQLDLDCDPVQRGDLVRPFVARPAPQFHGAKLDPFAPPSGKKTAMVVTSKDYMVLAAAGRIAYVNLGNAQGVRVGDYFRVFRYQGTHAETNYQVRDMAYKAYGFGSAPLAYQWNDLPRQIVGEGIVLRTGTNSSTVMLTNVRFEIYAGDYVELE